MRWPRRRAGGRQQPAVAAPSPERPRSTAPAAAPRRRPTPPQRGDLPPASTPTTEWARVAPLRATAHLTPPLTFHGDRFGRSVAGARSMAASMRHRPTDPGRAPSGVLLDATRIESVGAVEPHTAPEIPAVLAVLPATPPVHRRPVVAGTVTPDAADHDLMTADTAGGIAVGFEPAPERERPLTAMSWNPTAGFATAGSPDGADPAAVSGEPGEPKLRFVPAPGPRRERAPRDLVDIVTGVTGVDVGDAVIDRSPEVSDRARAIGAIAFTERATVHLPAELGDIDAPVTRAVVAHELTHVAQQRSGGTPPSEDSPAGRALEHQARAVQRTVAAGVRPHFMRSQVGSLDSATGVQRLADDDPYAWQERDEDPSDDRALEMLGFAGHFGSRERDPDSPAEETYARAFEERHARTLQHRRNERYQELREETLRERRIELLREDDDSEPELDRHDLLDLRESVDDEMPWQFGPPDGIDPYPETLPPAEEGDDEHRRHGDRSRSRRTAGRGRAGAAAGGAAGARRLRASTGRGASTGPGARRGGRGARGGAHSGPGGSGQSDDEFEWQHREPTDQGAITAMFGGGLFGSLLGLAAGPETDDDRAAAEAATPRLHEQRRDRERQLRHVALRSKLTEGRREETLSETQPVTLSRDEIIEIRERVDQAMPLQFVTPEYLDMLEDARITNDGAITRAERLDDDEDGEGTGGGTRDRDAAGPPGSRSTPSPDGDRSTARDTDRFADHDDDTDTDDTIDTDDHQRRSGRGRVGRAVASTGAAMLAGRIADRLDGGGDHDAAHDDEHGLDEDAAARIFAAASDLDIDVLSRRIWHRIRREMRSELIVDRERAGSLADIR